MADPSDNPDPDSPAPLDGDLRDLERRLERLEPAAPRSQCVQRSMARRKALFSGGRKEAAGRRVMQMLPLGLAAVVTLTGALLLHDLSKTPVVEEAPAVAVDGTGDDESAAAQAVDLSYGVDLANMIPVSVESSLREVEAEPIVVIEGQGPMRPVLMHYEAAQCWIDPESQTTVQVIQPWQETVFYPVSTY